MRHCSDIRLTLCRRAIAVLCLLSGTTALAQTATNIPSGSPLDQQSSSQQSQKQNGPGSVTGNSQPIDNPYGGGGLLQPYGVNGADSGALLSQQLAAARLNDQSYLVKPPASPGEFEKYIETLLGRKLKRFGEDLVLPAQRDFAAPAEATSMIDPCCRYFAVAPRVENTAASGRPKGSGHARPKFREVFLPTGRGG